ncbi:MAG: xth [Xanthomonadaceae bacterium]|nr:xth [Xanthomonadaceae bacterium]
MKIASWNVNSLNVRMPHLEQWLRESQPDIVGLQETKLEDGKFPDTALAALGYRSVFAGQKSYNGVAILARGQAIEDVQVGIPGFEDAQQRVIAATVGGIRVVNFYVVNGQSVGSEKFDYKLRWLRAAQGMLEAEVAAHRDLVVLGDFNIAPTDIDVHNPKRWQASVMCSAQERDALAAITRLDLHDSFRLHCSEPGHHSWWDYRLLAFDRGWGLRIDLVLVSAALRARCTAAGIDLAPRTWERPSDHAPVWAEFDG